MNYLFTSFRVELVRRLHSWKTWGLMALLPALVWATLMILPAEERTAPVQVGVAFEDEEGDSLLPLLQSSVDAVVTFHPSDEDTIIGKVASGQWDCGILIAKGFLERLEDADTDRLITLYIGEGSTVYPLVQETVTACVARLAAPEMAREYLLDSGILSEATDPAADGMLGQILSDDARVMVTMETLDGRPLDALDLADDSMTTLMQGMIAIVLLIRLLFLALDLGRWLETPAVTRMRALRGDGVILLPRAMAAGVLDWISCGAALCLLPEGQKMLVPLCAYLILLCSFALLIARVRVIWTALPILMPFVPVICLLLSPVLLDVRVLLPELGLLQNCVPVTWFLAACNEGWSITAAMAAVGAVFIAVSLGLDAKKQCKL